MAPGKFAYKPAWGKWWKSFKYTKGMVVQTNSPYRGDHIVPFIKHIPHSLRKKVTENFWDVVPAFTSLGLIVYWSDSANDAMHRSHRS